MIVGSGMAGLSAGLYAGRYELSPLVIGEIFGGATSSAWTIENYPGFLKIDGYDLMTKVKEQVESLGGRIKNDKVEKIEETDGHFVLHLSGGEKIETRTVVLAMGADRRKLGVAKEEEFAKGKGIHYCVTCDGPLYKGKTIAVIGGGDAAIKGLNLAVQYVEKIYVVFLEEKVTAEPVNLKRLEKYIGNKIEIIPSTSVAELLGDTRLTGAKLTDSRELKLDGLFVEIGAVPAVGIVKELGVKLDEKGYISVNNQMETNIPGIFAAGDTTSFFGSFKQDITAAAMGAVAATSAFRYLG